MGYQICILVPGDVLPNVMHFTEDGTPVPSSGNLCYLLNPRSAFPQSKPGLLADFIALRESFLWS
jgi:hypothetical protein